MKKAIILIFLVVPIIGVVIYIRKGDSTQTTNSNIPSSSNQDNTNQIVTAPPEIDPNVETYTMTEVRKHGPESWDNGDSSPLCWMVISDKVYEIPDNFVETHPGGHVIYEGCGTNATTFFETRPQGTGTPHSADARKLLENYYIGDLKK